MKRIMGKINGAKQHRRKSRIMQNFMLSYILILIIPLIIFIYAFSTSIATIDKNAAAYHLSLLTQAKDALEMRLREVSMIAMQITEDPNVNTLLYAMENEAETPFKIWECQQDLVQYTVANQYISQAYISVQKGRKIISTSYYHKENAKSEVLSVNGSSNILFSPLFEFSHGKISSIALKDDKVKENQTLMYSKTFPDGVIDSAYGNVCLIFDQKKLESLLSFSNEWSGGCNAILDENNRVLVSSGGDIERILAAHPTLTDEKNRESIELDGEKMSISYLNSQENNWTYLSAYPQNQVLSDTISAKKLLTTYSILAIALGVLLSALMALRNTRPIKQIMRSLMLTQSDSPQNDSSRSDFAANSNGNEYHKIQSMLDKLIAENNSLATHSQGQKVFVREAIFRILLNGEILDNTLIRDMSEEIGVDLENACFIGIHFDLVGLGSSQLQLQLPLQGMSAAEGSPFTEYIRQIIDAKLGTEGYAYYYLHEGMLALLCFPATKRLEIYSLIKNTISEVENASEAINRTIEAVCNPVIGISNVYTNLSDVYKCGHEAQFASEYSKIFEFGRATFYDQVNESINPYKFTLNDHQHLLNVLKSGNTDDAQKVFNDLIRRNIVESSMNAEMMEQLFHSIKGVLLEGMDFAGDEKVKATLAASKLQENDRLSSFLALEDIYIEVTSGIGEKRSQKGTLLMKSIISSLEQDFMDPGISISSIADKFGISEAYLTKSFKEHTDVTFAAYLEALRMEQAKKLLKEDKLKMVQIARITGYNSVESFRRAFKRINGISPSDYKEL